MKRLLFSLLFFPMQSLLAMDKAEVKGSKSEAYTEYEEEFPVFENFPLIESIAFYLAQQSQSLGTSRYSFTQEEKKSDFQSSDSCTSLDGALALLAIQKGEKWVECDGSLKFKVKKCLHKGRFKQPISTIFFECKQEPSAGFLRNILPLATNDGPYQMVRVVDMDWSRNGKISNGKIRDIERLAQRIGFSFYGRARKPLEWRRLSEKVFQEKIRLHSPGAAKRNRSRGSKRGNSSKR